MLGSHSNGTLAVLHGGALGDCVLAIHFSCLLRANWNAKLTLIARSPIAQWAARHGFVDEAMSLDEVGAHRWFGDAPSPVGDAMLSQFDRIVSLLGGPNEPISKALREASGKSVIAVDPRARPDRVGVHITGQWAWQVKEQTGQVSPVLDVLKLSSATKHRLRVALADRLNAADRRIAIIHPGSGGRAKCCPIRAVELLTREFDNRGWHAAWMIGPDEVERDGPEFIRRLEGTRPIVFEESANAAADLAAGADAYIGNDAGMTHVAALAGVRTIALFGPTDPRVWRPLGAGIEVARFPAGDGADWGRNLVDHMEALVQD